MSSPAKLVEEAKAKQEMLQLLGELNPEDAAYVDDACVERYLRAREYSAREAAEMLLATLKWRKEFGVDGFKMEDFMTDVRRGRFYIAGLLDDGVPVLVMNILKQVLAPKDEEEHSKFMCYTLEKTTKLMKRDVEAWIWVLNLKDYTVKRAPSVSLVLKMVKILQNHYPERMGLCYLVDAPKVFSVIYKIVYRFVDPATREKVFFVRTEDYDANGNRKDGKEDSMGFGKFAHYCHTIYDVDKFKAYLQQAN